MQNDTLNLDRSLCIAQSKSNRRLFVALLILTGGVYMFDLFAGGVAGSFTLISAGVTAWQALRTYVARTIFTADGVEHRTSLGKLRMAKYRSLLILTDKGESIELIGEDVDGRNLKITLREIDGDLQSVSAFLDVFASRTPLTHSAT